MEQLTAAEQKLFNNLSQVRDSEIKLGDILVSLIGQSAEEGTPVNAVNAAGTLTISGVVKDGEKVTIGDDVYEFLADEAQTKTAPGNIAVDITSHVVFAVGTLTIDTQPTAGNTMWIGTKIYTFVPEGTANAEGEVSVGLDLAAAKVNIVAAINGTDSFNNPSDEVEASDFVADDCTITALIGGTAGNSIPTTETFTAVTNIFAAVTLLTGDDCLKADAVTELVAAITASGTEPVTAADGAGDTVVLTADVAGTLANAIATTETMANGAFGAAHLTGGVNGTVATDSKFMMDATYLYVCLESNTIADKNWRRIALGAAY